MNRTLRFGVVLLIAIGIAAMGSHMLAAWLKIKTQASEPFVFGKANGNPPAFLSGSSLADYGISWDQISTQLDLQIKVWGVAGGSPYEFEQFQKQVPEARTTFIVVSAYDLDEAMVCDFRAAIVPVTQTIHALRETHMSWKDSKQVLSQYPMTWLRRVFPTIGRSRGLMGKLKEKIVTILRPSSASSTTEAGPKLDFGKEQIVDRYKLEKISDWSESKTVAKVAAMRAGIQGQQGFNGLKALAFRRMLAYAAERGRTIVIVLPVSPAYSREFMQSGLAHDFEVAMIDAQRSNSQLEWLRLDQLPGLAANENFCDLVHMNVFGKQRATEAFRAWLKQTGTP